MYKRKMIKVKDLKTGPVLDRSLPEGFIKRVIEYKGKLSEVETSSLEETVLNFQRDHYPERELEVWEQIAEMYINECNLNKNWKLTDKKRYFKTVIAQSLGING